MAKTGIKWNRSDYAKLSIAVKKYNKNIEGSNIQKTSYQEQKSNIKTRQGLNQVLKYLNSSSLPNALNEITLENGEKITKLEYDEFIRSRNYLKKSLNRKKAEWEKKEGDIIFSKAQLNPSEYQTILGDLERLNDIEKLKGQKFKTSLESVLLRGNSNYEFWKAEIYRKNYIETMNRYSDLEGFDKLKEKFNAVQNPLKFYDFFKDFELAGDLTLLSDKTLQQSEFNVLLEEIGIDTSNYDIISK